MNVEHTKEGQKTIAIVANSAWYIYNFRLSLIKRLHREGYSIYVLTPVDDYINFLVDNDYIQFLPLKHLSRKKINLWEEYRLYKELKKLYQKIRPNIVLHYTIKANIYGTLAARKLGIASLVVIPGLGYTFTASSKLKSLITKVYRWVLPYNKAVIFENKSDLNYFEKNNILPQGKGVVFKGCGVDTDHFCPMEKLESDRKFTFLFMGRLIKEKGIEDYIHAANIVHQEQEHVDFAIIGHIDAENPTAIPNEVFLDWIKPSYIKYLGFKNDVRDVIREVDAVVLPSYYPEGIPRVLQEAMSMEKPIITADSDGCREALDEGINGYLCQAQNPQDLARVMLKMLALSKEDLMALGMAGRQKAIQEFQEEISLKKYLEIINLHAHASSPSPVEASKP